MRCEFPHHDGGREQTPLLPAKARGGVGPGSRNPNGILKRGSWRVVGGGGERRRAGAVGPELLMYSGFITSSSIKAGSWGGAAPLITRLNGAGIC